MYKIFLLIAPFFGIILVGYIFSRLKIAKYEWIDGLNNFVLKIGFPSIIFTSLAKARIDFAEQSILIIINSVFIVFCFILAIVASKVFKLNKSMKRTLFICLPFGNIAYLGLPVLLEVYGQNIITYGSIVLSMYLIWIFTLGVYYLEYSNSGQAKTGKILINLSKNPLLIAVVLGVIASFITIPVGSVFMKTFDMIARATTPVIMFSIGIFISQISLGRAKEWIGISFFTFTKLIVLPGILFIIFHFANFHSSGYTATIVESAMPLALTPYALAKEYNLDREFITKSILMSTIISIITLSAWMVTIR
jgi:predicted permease